MESLIILPYAADEGVEVVAQERNKRSGCGFTLLKLSGLVATTALAVVITSQAIVNNKSPALANT